MIIMRIKSLSRSILFMLLTTISLAAPVNISLQDELILLLSRFNTIKSLILRGKAVLTVLILFIIFAMPASAYVGLFDDFTTEPNQNISLWHSATLPSRGIDYDMYSNGRDEGMWILTNDNVSREYIDGMYYFNPLIDLKEFPIISYSLAVSDGNVNAGIEYMEVSNGSGTIKIWGPDSYYSSSSTSWVNRSFNAYDVAMSKGNYRYLKSIGLMLRENSVELKDGNKHYAYWDYIALQSEKPYTISISNDKYNWTKITTDNMLIKPGQNKIVSIDNIWEYSDLSNVRYLRTEGLGGNLWIDSIKMDQSPVTPISSSTKINLISADDSSYMFVTPGTGKAKFIFKAPAFNKLKVTDNTKVVINYDNGTVSNEPDWGLNYINGILTLGANLSDSQNYIILDLNPTKESVMTGSYGYTHDETESNIIINSSLDWYWYQSESARHAQYAKYLTSHGKKVILRVWWWDLPDLKNRTWTDLYYNQSLLNMAINDAISQIDTTGTDSFYAISLSEEEPGQGYYHTSTTGGAINQEHYVYGSNKIYNAIKLKYPGIKIFAGTHIDALSDANLSKLSRDGIIDDKYEDIDSMSIWFDKLVRMQSNEEVYAVIWSSPGGFQFDGEQVLPSYTEQAFELAKNKGLKNIGFFAYTENPTQQIQLFDYPFNYGWPQYLRPELFKVIMTKIMSKYSI